MVKQPTLAVSEIFGPTFQGEGPSMGQQAVFLRLSGCNLKCIWCDTKYTWDWTNYDIHDETKLMSLDEVYTELIQHKPEGRFDNILVITGGEPLLQWRVLDHFLQEFILPFRRCEIETNGTIQPRFTDRYPNMYFNVSPKLSNSGEDAWRDMKPWFVNEPNARFKFVVETADDLDEVVHCIDVYNIHDDRVWIMPQARNEFELDNKLRYIAEEVLAHGWNLTTRMHLQLWGNTRGR